MTAAARNFFMPSRQGVLRLVVIKSRRRLPSLFVMAISAGIAELSAMLIEVTSTALGWQSQIGLSMRLLSEKGQNQLATDQPPLVALVAFHLRVLAQEWESHLLMGKRLLWPRPVNQ